jgi:hypothetical protein
MRLLECRPIGDVLQGYPTETHLRGRRLYNPLYGESYKSPDLILNFGDYAQHVQPVNLRHHACDTADHSTFELYRRACLEVVYVEVRSLKRHCLLSP